MTKTNTSVFSSCREIAVLDADHDITLVQHIETHRIYVKKPLDARSADVYSYLSSHYIEGIPEVIEVVRIPAPGESGPSSNFIAYALEEYVSGQLLLDVLDNGNLFPVAEAVDITEQLCRILQNLHSSLPPIVGCDLLPSNIIVTSDGLIRIRDLRSSWQMSLDKAGIKSTGPSCSREPDNAERTEPVAPILQDDTLQEDILSVGALFCRLITGYLPGDEFSGGRLPGGKPGQIIRRCLNPDPSKRYPDLHCLLRNLDACRVHPTPDHSITSGSIYDRTFRDRFPGDSLSGSHLHGSSLSGNSFSGKGLSGNSFSGNELHHSFENRHSLPSSSLSGHPYLLPGFRSKNPLHYLIAFFAYGLLIRLSLTFTLEDFPPGYQMWVARLVFFLCGSAILLFTGNWLDIWRHLQISRIRNPLVRLLVILMIDAVLFMLSILAIIFTGLALGIYHASWF